MRFLFTVLLFFSLESLSQSADSIQNNNSYVLRIIPSAKDNIFGLSIGLIGSEAICNIPNVKKSHGLNIQLFGQGFFVLLNRKVFSFEQTLDADHGYLRQIADSNNYKAKHNGLIVSSFGTFTDVINGISISSGASLGFQMNGISFNLVNSKYGNANGLIIALINQTNKINGLQIGLINRTNELHGFQIGIWNVNSKRKLPFFNWSF